MKTSNYLWAVLATATLSLSACGSDENENVNQPKEKTARLELTLVGTPADSRATGTLPTTDESQINRLTVAVFTGASGNPVNALREFTGDDIKAATSGTGKKITMLCEPGNGQTIYVVANASTGLFAGVTNLAGFKAKLMLLSETTKAAGAGAATDTQKANNLPMLGSATGKDFTAGTETEANIALSRLVARVSMRTRRVVFSFMEVTGVPIQKSTCTRQFPLIQPIRNSLPLTTSTHFRMFQIHRPSSSLKACLMRMEVDPVLPCPGIIPLLSTRNRLTPLFREGQVLTRVVSLSTLNTCLPPSLRVKAPPTITRI